MVMCLKTIKGSTLSMKLKKGQHPWLSEGCIKTLTTHILF